MTLASPFKTHPTVASIGVLVIAMISIQIGAALAKHLFPAVGAQGATALRLAIGACFLAAIWHPWRMRPSARELRAILLYGFVMGWMNLLFYSSLMRIPLGIAVALEFTGPLTVAMIASRRLLDFVWIALAAVGLALLLPLRSQTAALSATGVMLALGAGACWALYIVFGKRTGNRHAGQTAALGMLVAAVVIVPVGIAHSGSALFEPSLMPVAFAVALLSSALPYTLEMFALRRLPTRTFGVLMSIEPALGSLSGLILLGEELSVVQWSAVASIMIASAGSAATSRSAPESTVPPKSLAD